jgi:hypothetical protein
MEIRQTSVRTPAPATPSGRQVSREKLLRAYEEDENGEHRVLSFNERDAATEEMQ